MTLTQLGAELAGRDFSAEAGPSPDAEAWHDARVRGGVIRQSLPNALQHQVEAAQLAANKRQAEAADPAEQRAKRAAAEQVRRDRDDMSEDEWQAFTAWREEFGNVDLHVSDWHASSEY